MAARTKSEQFRVNAEEKAHLRKAATDAGFPNMSAYLRELTLARTVVTFAGTDIVLIPAYNSSDAHDKRVEDVLLAALKTLNGSAPSQPPPDPVDPAGRPPAPPVPAAADSAPAAPPAGGVDPPVVGTSEDAPPAAPAPVPASPPPGAAAPPAATGASTSPAARPHVPVSPPSEPSEGAGGETAPISALRAEGSPVGECPLCGGRDGNHQSFCETITGEPPVEGGSPPTAPPPVPTGNPIETREQFIQRRGAELLGEGQSPVVAAAIAEAEWRKALGQPTSTECPNCGTVKLDASKPCPDCGA